MAIRTKATFKLTGWNAPQLKQRIPQILTSYGETLGDQFKEEITKVQFEWPRQTRRRNGTIVGSPRNIVDTGAFLNSQRRDRPSATELRFTWGGDGGVDYAGNILKGEDNKPQRNWIKPALESKPLEAYFADEWKRLAGKGL